MKKWFYFLWMSGFFFPYLQADVSPEKINQAIRQGVSYIIQEQSSKGSWSGEHADDYPMGKTALALLALLKSDIPYNHPVIVKGLKSLQKIPFQKTYSVALYLMLMETKFQAQLKFMPPKYWEKSKKIGPFRLLATPAEKKRVLKAASWLVSHRSSKSWGYPRSDEDNSNTQYAMLGLAAAERMGIATNKKVYFKVMDHFISTQEKEGDEVVFFKVPAADEPISSLQRKDLEKKKARLQNQKKAYLLYPSGSPLKARGWGYREANPATGSMTTAGIACMVICKAHLENSRTRLWKKLLPQVNASIRDGCAWITQNFRVDGNPNGGNLFYYLYGLERAGILAGVIQFGSHDWYRKGAEHILGKQKENGQIGGGVVDTCFALLFLRRATVPMRTND